MTKAELEARATELERFLDSCEFYSEDEEIEAEEELCKIYMMLKSMRKLEAE